MKINVLEHEDLLMEKELYSSLGIDAEENPIQVLSSVLKQTDTVEDQNIIRFIQGERYFLLGDFESAIFKWGMAEDTVTHIVQLLSSLCLNGRCDEPSNT